MWNCSFVVEMCLGGCIYDDTEAVAYGALVECVCLLRCTLNLTRADVHIAPSSSMPDSCLSLERPNLHQLPVVKAKSAPSWGESSSCWCSLGSRPLGSWFGKGAYWLVPDVAWPCIGAHRWQRPVSFS